MLTEQFEPRFTDTDALGHINNTRIPVWFEGARMPVFRVFTPDLNVRAWKLMIARYDVEFHGELFYGIPVEIRTWVSRLGNSSFDVTQEVWQNGERRASGTTVLVHYDHQAKQSVPLSEELRQQLEAL
ncbi:acyl-CoA thioesterase [Natronospirillum operosum]|uniref:Acyl-CoA thioesterase n=1 Tax=Natronospirillum operosum TaxID=2759953 RepID=A0A4Z0WC85_9GAMM|nr:thioesterase family protein [Natronospirillum operosum]TGG91275.1 acyl-CoA thioesterase [Natronospirillum operosum]